MTGKGKGHTAVLIALLPFPPKQMMRSVASHTHSHLFSNGERSQGERKEEKASDTASFMGAPTFGKGKNVLIS